MQRWDPPGWLDRALSYLDNPACDDEAKIRLISLMPKDMGESRMKRLLGAIPASSPMVRTVILRLLSTLVPANDRAQRVMRMAEEVFLKGGQLGWRDRLFLMRLKENDPVLRAVMVLVKSGGTR